MKVRLTRKLAECLDGIDVSAHREGDLLTLDRAEAELLIAEGWATPYPKRSPELRSSTLRMRTFTANDREGRRRLNAIREQLAQGNFDPCDHRRTEDDVRDEIRDARAHTIKPRR